MFVLFYIQLFSYFRCKCAIKRSVQFKWRYTKCSDLYLYLYL